MKLESLQSAKSQHLLNLYSIVLKELLNRGLIRSTNNPASGYAEFLAAKALNLHLAPNSTTGYDARDSHGKRYEIKARRLTSHNKSRQLSVIRGLDRRHFDFLVGVLFGDDFAVMRACVVPRTVVEKEARYRQHVNGWILHLRDRVWEQRGVRDVTKALREATIG